MRSILLYLIGVPIPIILLIALSLITYSGNCVPSALSNATSRQFEF
jgi:hypothetical protein